MSLSTYAELKTAVATWLHRDDLTSQIDDFIDLAEADYGRRLRIRAMEDSTTSTLSAASLALPTDYLQTRRFSITFSGQPTQIEQVAPELVLGYAATGMPERMAVLGDSIYFGPAPDGTYTYLHWFYKKIAALSGSQTTNWVLTNAPDIYLYGSLSAAAPFIKNDARLPMWQKLYDDAVKQLAVADDRDRHAGPAMRVRVA